MKAHSSKYLNAAHTSMALATVALQGLLPHSAKDACNSLSTYLGRSHRSINFTMGIEKEAPVPSLILSSANHATSSKTAKAKPRFHGAEMNLSLSPQKQQFTMFSFPIPRSTANIEKSNNNNLHFILVIAA